MTADSGPGRDENRPVVYEIRIKGHVSRRWAGWFDGLAIILETDGSTRLIGPVADQAALHGFLRKVRDLGAPAPGCGRTETTPAGWRRVRPPCSPTARV